MYRFIFCLLFQYIFTHIFIIFAREYTQLYVMSSLYRVFFLFIDRALKIDAYRFDFIYLKVVQFTYFADISIWLEMVN